MQIIEVKNNLVKISYDAALDVLVLSGFVFIKDEAQSFIAQIMHLEANAKGNFAILKLIFNFNLEGVVTNYNGAIPNFKSEIQSLDSQDIISLIEVQDPVVIGELAQQGSILKLDRELYEDKLLVCSDKADDWEIFAKNTYAQLKNQGKKLVVFDFDGDCDLSENKVVAGEDFKLPLNYDSINFIYESGLDDASAESKALIQDVFLEVQNYVKTLDDKYLPFESFKTVVDEQYEELGIVELVLLKNKLLKYKEQGIFAQEKSEISSLSKSLNNKETTIFDISKVDEMFQREMISYVYSLIKDGVYVLLKLSNKNSDKKLLKQIFAKKNVYTTFICPYSYKYLTEVKQLVKNMLFFPPIAQQNDFASYNVLLNKLNQDEFIVYGKASHHIPFVVKASDLPQKMFEEARQHTEQELTDESITAFESDFAEDTQEFIQEDEPAAIPYKEETVQDFSEGEELSADDRIKKEVDAFYTKPKTQVLQEQEEEQSITNEDLTDEDLDFLEELNLTEKIEISEYKEENQGLQQDTEAALVSEAQTDDNIVDELPEQNEESILEENDLPDKEDQPIIEDEAEDVLEEIPEPPALDILPASVASTPIVPIYAASEDKIVPETQSFEQGDEVVHSKYGKGVVEKTINYGSKTLCSINFDNVGRRLLDPAVSELERV